MPRKLLYRITEDDVNDTPTLGATDIEIVVAKWDKPDQGSRSTSDIVLADPRPSMIMSAVVTTRAIFQRMKNYTS